MKSAEFYLAASRSEACAAMQPTAIIDCEVNFSYLCVMQVHVVNVRLQDCIIVSRVRMIV